MAMLRKFNQIFEGFCHFHKKFIIHGLGLFLKQKKCIYILMIQKIRRINTQKNYRTSRTEDKKICMKKLL